MSPKYLAWLALARLPKPYTEEESLHVFCEIERTPHLRKAYDDLLDEYDQGGLNSQIGMAVSSTLGATQVRQVDVGDACELVRYPSLLADVQSVWRLWE